jgi:membrane protease YdiL (CAAX protease family)
METAVQTEPRSDRFDRVASPWHTFVVLGAIGVLVFWGRLRADQMRAAANPDRVALYEHTILFEWLTLGLVLVGVWLGGSSLRSVLGNRWRSVRDFLRDAGIGLLFLVTTIVVTSILGGHGGGDKAIQFLLPRGGVELALWIVLSITAGICEEAVYRGYLQKQFMALTKNAPAGIVISAIVFGLAHSYQGFARASLIGVTGAMAGILAYWRRSVRPGMIAHSLQDVLGAFVRH